MLVPFTVEVHFHNFNVSGKEWARHMVCMDSMVL